MDCNSFCTTIKKGIVFKKDRSFPSLWSPHICSGYISDCMTVNMVKVNIWQVGKIFLRFPKIPTYLAFAVLLPNLACSILSTAVSF